MMELADALTVLARHRGDRVVLTTMAAVGVWPGLSDTPLDFAYVPSSMGQGPAVALGLALAQPGRGVIAVTGDGSLLMNLGCLVTIASHPAEVFLVILDNGQYEVTGGQPTVGSGHIDFAGLARAAGFPRAHHFADLPAWEAGAAAALRGPGPVAIWLTIRPRPGQQTPKPPRPMAEQIRRLRAALGVAADGA
jgi:thiamine pyrophosphate-dependent acetolactate synthase large subunit-like protein